MPSRNDPCPCGSGRKYKQCCMRRDESAHPALRVLRGSGARGSIPRELDLAAERINPHWEADLLPIPAHFDNDPSARPTLLLVAAGELILHSDVLANPPSEPDAIAQLLLDAIGAAK